MMPASKHGDPQLGIDIHLCSTPAPVPLPTPHMSVVFDPFDYVPILGATITVCGMKRATAGTSGVVVHIPPGFPFAPALPQKDDELFMGSATVVADGDPMSYIALPVLGCQIAGMMSPPRLRKKGPKKMMLAPLNFNLAIPTNVFVGGPPTISLMGLAMQGAFAALGKIAKSGVFKRMRQKLFKNMKPGFLKCTILRAEPVNILSGAVSVEQQDFVLPGRIPVQWRRTYGSDNPRAGQCGVGWETPADARLEISHDGVLMHYPGVGPLHFNGVPVGEGDTAAELELQDGAVLTDADGEYRVRTKEDRIYHFPKSWRSRELDGGSTIALSMVSDLCGNSLRFERDSGGLTAIQESAGRRLEFRTGQGRILEIALVTPGAADRHVYVKYAYDAQGDLIAARDALDQPYTFGYEAHHMVRHTDRNGLSFYYEYDASSVERRVVRAWGDGGLYDYRFEYSEVLKERRITDSLGHVSTVKLNEQGLPINEIDALGGVTIYEYDEAGRTTAVTDQDGHRTEYTYDRCGNVLQTLRPDGSKVQMQFDALNKAVAIVDPRGSTWQQTWDHCGLLISQVTPAGHPSRYAYDAHGQLITFINPRDARTMLGFDGYGNLTRVTDALGHVTRFGYDSLGNVTGKLDELGRRTLFEFDVNNRLTHVRLPSGAEVRCSYDGEGNLTRYVDESGLQTRLEYFGQGKVAKRFLPDGTVIDYDYDTEEQLIAVRNQLGEVYRFDRDAAGRIVKETDYWGQSRSYQYSLAGRIRESGDALNRITAYATDPLGRILKKTLPHPLQHEELLEETFAYDADGNLLAAENADVRVEQSYDPDGRLILETHGEARIQYAYDACGNRIGRHSCIQHDNGQCEHRIRYAYDALDHCSEIQIDEHAPIRIERDAAGQIVAEQLSAELRRELEYGVDGRRTKLRLRAGTHQVFEVGYLYSPTGELVERHDDQFGIDRFIYDPMGRVTQHTDPQGGLHQYLNDPVGNRLAMHVAARQEPSAEGDGGQQWARQGSHQGALYRFDRSGNLILRDDGSSGLQLTWDANQRLVRSSRDGVITDYRYDALGRRIEKSTGGERTRFAWDGDALLAEHGRGVVREWVYLPGTFEPFAMLDVKGAAHALYHYHNDPNGAPVRVTTSKGEVQWCAAYETWGGIAQLHVDGLAQPLRLQGQYYDPETGLHYNRHRYFDPRIGQFISPDPLGLAAGLNPFEFASNTLTWADPLGLKCSDELITAYKHFRSKGLSSADALKRAKGLEPEVREFMHAFEKRYPGRPYEVSFERTHSVTGRKFEIDFETDNAILEFKAGNGSGLTRQIRDRTDVGLNPGGKTLIGVAGKRGLSGFVRDDVEKVGGLASDMKNVPTILDAIAP